MQIEGVNVDVLRINVGVSPKLDEHPETALLVATSEDMRGLFVAGRSMTEILERTPQAIKAMRAVTG